MLRLHKRFPNVLLPAALILLAIVANPAPASGRKPLGDTLLPPAAHHHRRLNIGDA